MNINFNSFKNRDESIRFHYREFTIDEVRYKLEFCSGPSFVETKRTDQLYMEIRVIPKLGEIEVYTLKRYPSFSNNVIVEHISINRDTNKTRNRGDKKSLDILLDAIRDERITLELLNSFPSIPLKGSLKKGIQASDYDLMNMFFKHLY